MTTTEADRLREGFASAQNVAGDGADCPTTERIWDSAAEKLAGEQNESILRHLSTCGACAASWRVAREMLSEQEAAPPVPFDPARRRRARTVPVWAGLAAAALLVVAVGVVVMQQQSAGPAEPAFRAAPGGDLAARIDPGTQLPRGEFVLRWDGAPAGSTYDLRVTDDRLEPLHRVFGLAEAEYRVPDAALADVAPGGTVLWSVTAHLPDGRRWNSVTFRARVD